VLQHYREAIVIVAELSLTNSNTSAMNLVIGPRTHDSPSFTMPSHVSH
jgi:hypothetical protein